MRSIWSVFVAALGAGACALALAAGASASPPMTATGTETFTDNFTCIPGVTCKTADGNMFITVANPGSKTGTFTGRQVFDGALILNKDFSFNFSGIITFTGTVTGCGTGTVVFGIEGAGYLLSPVGPPVFTRNHQHTLFGKGTLAVHANLELTGPPGNTSVYTGNYHC